MANKKKDAKARRGLFDNKRFVLVISFVTALLAWIVIGGWIKPNDTLVIDNVVIDYTRGSSNYRNRDLEIVGDMPESASVEVSGDGNVLLSLANTDVTVYCDYSAVNEAGTYEIPLTAEQVNTGFDIEEWTPATVTLQFEKVHRTSYTLSVQANSVTAAKGYYRDEPVPSTLQVDVSGPEGEMEQVAGAAVIIDDIVERTTMYTVSDAEVVLLDKNGDVLPTSELVTISPAVVTVEIPILPEKELPLSVGITGAPPGFDEDWMRGLISITTKGTITVAGEASLLENLSELPVGDVDISDFSLEDTYKSFDISIPEGLKNLTGLQKVSVSLDASGLSQRKFEVPLQDIRVVSEPDGYSVTPVDIDDENAVLEVTLLGASEEMSGLLLENITVEIDASSVVLDGDEQQLLALRVYVPRSGRIFATGQYTLLCDVREAVEDSTDASGS